jgi:hypothetical protein
MFKSVVEMLVRMICVLTCLRRIDLYRYRFISVTEILNRYNFEKSELSKSVPKERLDVSLELKFRTIMPLNEDFLSNTFKN